MTLAVWMVETWKGTGPHELTCFGGDRMAAGRYAAAMKEQGFKAVAWNLMDGRQAREE